MSFQRELLLWDVLEADFAVTCGRVKWTDIVSTKAITYKIRRILFNSSSPQRAWVLLEEDYSFKLFLFLRSNLLSFNFSRLIL